MSLPAVTDKEEDDEDAYSPELKALKDKINFQKVKESII